MVTALRVGGSSRRRSAGLPPLPGTLRSMSGTFAPSFVRMHECDGQEPKALHHGVGRYQAFKAFVGMRTDTRRALVPPVEFKSHPSGSLIAKVPGYQT